MDQQKLKIFSSVSDLTEQSIEEQINITKKNNVQIQDKQQNIQQEQIQNNKIIETKKVYNQDDNQDIFQQNFLNKYSNATQQKSKIINTQRRNQAKQKNKEEQIKQENTTIIQKIQKTKDSQQEQDIQSIEEEFESEELDDEEEYKKWKIRELKRIKRDKLERIQNQETPNSNLNNNISQQKYKSDYKYMQKYYKSMTFFQDSDDPIYKRDYNVAVGFDTFDKSQLPKYLQVRGDEFGKRGRSKYKDLLTEDTNVYDEYYNVDNKLIKKLKKN